MFARQLRCRNWDLRQPHCLASQDQDSSPFSLLMEQQLPNPEALPSKDSIANDTKEVDAGGDEEDMLPFIKYLVNVVMLLGNLLSDYRANHS